MKKIATLLLAACVAHFAHACDVCGCAGGAQYFGLLPKANLNFFGVQYQHNHLTTAHPSLFENRPYEHTSDYYNTVQLWGRYVVSKRLQLFGFVPYRYNLQDNDTSSYRTGGIGDMSVLANAVLANVNGPVWGHQLLAGGGLKLPTGRYAGMSEMDRLGLPNVQPGTGSWDFIMNANYTVKRLKYGVNTDASYLITTPGKDSHKYGNKLWVGSVVFYAVRSHQLSILPQAGIRYEYALQDYDNYKRQWLNKQSGGYMAFATVGMQAYYKRVGVRALCHMPFSQHYSSGYVTAGQRLDIGLFFLM